MTGGPSPRRALLVSSILPAQGGNGLAMRAGVFLDALAADHETTLLHVPLAGGEEEAGDFVRRRTRRVAMLPLQGALDPLYALSLGAGDAAARLAALRAYPAPRLCRWATSVAAGRAGALLHDGAAEAAAGFDVVVVLRSHLTPYAAPFLERGGDGGGGDGGRRAPLRVLDLDDDERLTQGRLGELHALHGRSEEALLATAEATKYAAHEGHWLARYDRALAASDVHRAAVRRRHPEVAVSVLPNTVEMPVAAGPLPPGRSDPSRLRLLFVGNLSYEPNVDAALRLAREVVPRLWQAGRQVELRIIGSRPATVVAALAGPGIEVHTDPADLAPHYAWATQALAPIRAGGGTRIKILEAFAAEVPVVATAIGAEGLLVRDGEHLLLADDDAGLAATCLRLADDPELARRLAGAARELVRRHYLRPAAVQTLRDLFAA